jgi:ankyrin repeat protein
MLADEANMQKQKKREEQLRRWKEREFEEKTLGPNGDTNTTIENYEQLESQQKQLNEFRKTNRVRFPKSCVFLAACSSGDTDEVRQHLKLGVNINTTNIDGLTALHQACIDANIEMVKFLVENNADINAQDNEGWTPLHASVSVGTFEVVKFLISKTARLDICNNDGDLPSDLTDSTNTQMKAFLDEQMRLQNIDAEYEKNKEELIMYEDVKEMKFHDKIHAKTGATPLHVSAAKGYSRVLKLLIQYGADVNALDNDGWTPLHAAAHWEQEEACKILSENGANFELKNYSLQTPFEVCDEEMISKLKILQKNSKNQKMQQTTIEKLADVTSLSNRLSRQNSGNISSSSSSTEKPLSQSQSQSQSSLAKDKILLSPIIMSNSPSDSNSSEVKNNLIDVGKENRNNSNSNNGNVNQNTNVNSLTTITTSTNNNSLNHNQLSFNDDQHNKQQLFAKSHSLNRIGDKDEINEKITNSSNSSSSSINSLTSNGNQSSINNNTNSTTTANTTSTTTTESNPSIGNNTNTSNNSARPNSDRRWGTTTNPTETSTYKRRIGGLNGNGFTDSTSIKTTNGTSNNNDLLVKNPSPTPTQTPTPKDPLGHLKNKLIEAETSNRRYSSAPIASKDEQAELIRKQKAKLERHFRRSTQAVSYEDIKNAEATIKGNIQSPGIYSPTSQEQMSNDNNNGQSPIFNFSTSSAITQPIGQGVSSLSTLFGEPKYKAISNPYTNFNTTTPTTPTTPTSASSTTTTSTSMPTHHSPNLAQNSPNNNTHQHKPPSIIQLSPNNSPIATPATDLSRGDTANGTDKDTLIANDIETDKLLNAIERSKGFSDFNSTTRRVRNRNNPYSVANTLKF